MSNRFEIKIGEFEEENIVDNLNKKIIREISDMCKKMNELNDENEQLKHDLALYEENNTNGVLNHLRIELTSRLNDCMRSLKND